MIISNSKSNSDNKGVIMYLYDCFEIQDINRIDLSR